MTKRFSRSGPKHQIRPTTYNTKRLKNYVCIDCINSPAAAKALSLSLSLSVYFSSLSLNVIANKYTSKWPDPEVTQTDLIIKKSTSPLSLDRAGTIATVPFLNTVASRHNHSGLLMLSPKARYTCERTYLYLCVSSCTVSWLAHFRRTQQPPPPPPQQKNGKLEPLGDN